MVAWTVKNGNVCLQKGNRHRRGAASLRYRNRAEITVLVCDQKPGMVFVPAQKLSSISGGCWGGALPSLIFRPNWGPKGRKNFFWGDRPSPPYLSIWMTGSPLIWRSGSVTEYSLNIALFSFYVYVQCKHVLKCFTRNILRHPGGS